MGLILLLFLIPDSTCVLCHSDLRGAYEASIHTSRKIGCTACHGGKSGTLDMKRAHKGNFKGVPTRQQIPELCGSCHSDPEMMRPFGIPIDQFLYYRSSFHGQSWAKGNQSTAVCTDCHGVHDILSSNDPRSPSSPLNITETCGHCHSQPQLMKEFNLSSSILVEYKESVHYEELQKGNSRAPTCVTCHGSHGASPPGIRQIEEICGICHSKTAEAFDISPHEDAFLREGLPECSVCHGNHKIRSYTTKQFLESCEGCHKEEDEAFRVAEKIQTLFLSTEEALDKANSRYQEVIEKGIPLLDLEPRLREGRTYLLAAYPLAHSLVVDTLEASLRKARSIAEDILAEVHEREGGRKEAIFVLMLFWFYVILTLVVAEAKRRTDREGR